jgi:hypothetical protein
MNQETFCTTGLRKTTRVAVLAFAASQAASLLPAQQAPGGVDQTLPQTDEQLSVETAGPWAPRVNVNADLAMVYPLDPHFSEDLESWKQHGYKVAMMTAAAWGPYQDYLNGGFDGRFHWGEAQMYPHGRMALHGDMSRITPYISPGDDFGSYLASLIQHSLDAGADAVYVTEPEYYADTGWSANFKLQWKNHFGEDWRPPDSSPDAQYRASKLKYLLYRQTLSQVCASVKQYGEDHARRIPCYIGTHSLINYAHWTIVSPESSLIDVGADGYIAVVWTGTARTPNVYEGRRKERTFETAFLEYAAMENMTRDSGRTLWYLNDPVEDDPKHSWQDYRTNWESTLTASLLNAEVSNFEVMPWPDRVFNGKHPVSSTAPTSSTTRQAMRKVQIPEPYATELQTVIGALRDMKQPDARWEHAGTEQAGVLISDTMMFERADPTPSDEDLGSFYGLALPLLKRGIPVKPVQIERASVPGFLERYKLLLLTYEGQKPPTPEFHEALAKWVRAGAALVVVDEDHDPYNSAREWWNTAPNSYLSPRQHLFEALGLPRDASGLFKIGDGAVVSARLSPAALTHRNDGGAALRQLAQQAADAIGLKWTETNSLVLRRGPFVIAAGLDESVPNAKPYVLRGRFIDLFDSSLPILSSVSVTPGKRILLFDLNATPAGANPSVIAAACRIREQTASAEKLSFLVDGIDPHAVEAGAHARRGQIGRSRRLRPRSGYIAFAFHQLGAAGANRN